jgi:hypothetical protein
MAAIHNPNLKIIPVEGHPGRRILRVGYDLVAAPGDALVGVEVDESIQVHGVDLHDALVPPNSSPIATHHATYTVGEGTRPRVLELAVHRTSLDVEQDWWNTGLGGETQPLAEWIDHLVAEIELNVDGEGIDQATTSVVTGSWGALGTD